MECMEVVESLSQKEKNTILSVLQRDEKLRDEQEQKIKKLKTEIAGLRCNAVLRAGDDQTKICLRCRQEFGFLFNRGALCPTCKYKVCKNCQEYLFNGSWLCALCYRQRQLKWLSGEWATFQQNPLRKWASGSDILRASMSLSATTIDIDNEPEPSLPPAQSKNNQRGRKPAHNGVSSQNKQDSKTRVEYPKENDQLKLSQLFDVLRSKKPTEEGPIETQVMRVSTRRYSESDSDSSSSSDLVLDTNSHRSSPNAPSVTESEFDARIYSPVSLSPTQSSVESPRSADQARQMAHDKGDRPTRPIPAPRSPKPAVRTKIKENQAIVRPKTRNVAESQVPEKSILKLGDESKVAMSRSVDINLGADLNAETEYKRRAVSHNELNLQLHVNKTKESLDKKSRSHNTLAAAEPSQEQKRSSDSDLWKGQKEYSKQKGDGLIERNLQRPASSDIITATTRGQPEKVKRKQKRNDAQPELRHEEHINARQNQAAESKPGKRQDTKGDKSREIKHEYVEVHIDSMPEADQVTIESVQKGEKGNNTDNHHDVSDRLSVSSKTSRTSADHETGGVGGHSKVSSDEDFQFTIPLPRTGSPYSFSMDSLPSSHPSPTLRQRTHDLSLVESSDTDSLSRFSQPELSEHSGTESLKSKNSEEDFDVEVLSKVRFQRVSKKVGQMGIMSKIKSPKRKKLAGVQEVPQPMSEGSTISQDDSGHVSGGSSGTTPEHKRQDSNFSSSSIPSTLSTVTDRSEEEEDIDKVITNLKLQNAGSRGNLLTVIADSRESICSFYSDAGDVAYNTVPITGEVLFGVNYNYKTSMLEVAVKQCKDIAIADTKKNKSDPYVKTYLLPDKTRSGKRKTKVKKHSTSPVFEETLRYSISKSELENRSLWLTVWHNDRFGRNVFLGEVSINFDYYKFDNPNPRWYPLQERTENQPASMMTYKGDLSISLKYVSPDKVNTTTTTAKGKQKKDGGKGQLHVKVKEARNLTAVRSNGFSDPFCKGYLLPERHKSSKQKTPVLKKNCNPTWNHTFIFEDISLMELRERCLELTIWDYDKLSSNDFLGGVRLNLGTGLSQGKSVDWMDARGEEMSIWQAMLDRPNLWIEGALILRPNMEKRKY